MAQTQLHNIGVSQSAAAQKESDGEMLIGSSIGNKRRWASMCCSHLSRLAWRNGLCLVYFDHGLYFFLFSIRIRAPCIRITVSVFCISITVSVLCISNTVSVSFYSHQFYHCFPFRSRSVPPKSANRGTRSEPVVEQPLRAIPSYYALTITMSMSI